MTEALPWPSGVPRLCYEALHWLIESLLWPNVAPQLRRCCSIIDCRYSFVAVSSRCSRSISLSPFTRGDGVAALERPVVLAGSCSSPATSTRRRISHWPGGLEDATGRSRRLG